MRACLINYAEYLRLLLGTNWIVGEGCFSVSYCFYEFYHYDRGRFCTDIILYN